MKRNLQLLMMKRISFSFLLLFTFTSVFAQVAGTWKLAPTAQALAVGPTQGDFSWWSNSAGDVSTRACLFDDKFVFAEDGTFSNVQDGETWLEGWQGVATEGCGTPVTPHDGSNAATWAYDEAAGTVTLTGVGAHLGLAKVNNAGELSSPAAAPASITYPVVIDGNTMTIDIDYGGGFWHFAFEKETETTPEPEPEGITGAWKLAPIAQALAVGPTQGDFSWWSNSAGDVSTRACLFDDQFVFGEDGTFSNVQDGETWLEGWQGVTAEGCGTPVTPHDGSNAATWAYDEAAGTVTLTGVGAHLGLAKVNNGGELTDPAAAPASITYPVVIDGDAMTVDINYGGGFWHFAFVRVTGTEPEPEPTMSNVIFSIDMNGYDGAFTQVNLSGSLNGWSGDANPLADADGDGIWSGTIPLTAGDYEYKFTLDNWAAQEEFAEGASCTKTTDGFTNRIITVAADAEICFKWNTCDVCEDGGTDEPATIAGAWKLAPIAQALAVGPTQGDFSWWSNSAGDVETRACLFDDQFVFEEDGTFSNVQDGSTWIEGWQGAAAEGCGTPVAPHDGSNAATWTYDEAAGTITLTGVGAHLGLAKVNNAGELTDPAAAPASITYPIVIEGNTMTVDINYGGGFWHFVFEKVTGTEPEPEPTMSNVIFSVDMNGYDGAFTQVNLSGSLNSWSGDANPLADADGDGIWSGTIPLVAGEYEYKFTLDNWAAQEEFAEGASCTKTTDGFTNRIIAVAADAAICFKWNTCDVCEDGGTDGGEPAGLLGTTWKLAPMAQALAVGPTQGDFSWWSNSIDDVATRACLFDDKFAFNADGTFSNIQDGETWLEGWQGVAADECGVPVAPHDGSNAATWSYDETAGTVTLTGVGAHLGLPKVHNGGELTNPADAPAAITYPVVLEGSTMTVDINYGGGFWHFVFERESTTSTSIVVTEELFSFFPNPASGQIQIRSDEVIDELTIHDITGKVLVMKNKPSSNETVDVSGLASGLYLIQIRVGHKISVEKLSIK